MWFQFIVLSFCYVFAEAEIIKLNCSDILAFVKEHNDKRLIVASGNLTNQPPAAEMNAVSWDPELAIKAAGWAEKMRGLQHNPDQTIGSKPLNTGENFFKASKSEKSELGTLIADAVNDWYKENKNYAFAPIPEQVDIKTGHYTQLVWSDSTSVGCGISVKEGKSKFEYSIVCNYYPGGNIADDTPYKKSEDGKGGVKALAGNNSGDPCPPAVTAPDSTTSKPNRANSTHKLDHVQSYYVLFGLLTLWYKVIFACT